MISLAKLPYYYFVIVFMTFVAILSLSGAGQSTSYEADFYLVTLLVSLAILVASAYYVYAARRGASDEFDLQVGGISIGKKTYYIAVIVIAVWRILAGFQLNHSTYGLAAIWGILWLIAGIGLAVFTYVNYRVLRGPNPTL
jgi:hypothetical protein